MEDRWTSTVEGAAAFERQRACEEDPPFARRVEELTPEERAGVRAPRRAYRPPRRRVVVKPEDFE